MQMSGPKNRCAVLARGDDGSFESLVAELTNEPNASLVRADASLFNDLIDQVVLAVPESANRFSIGGIVRCSLGQLNAARREKIANAVETGLPVHMKPVVGGDVERMEGFAPLHCTRLEVRIEHLFPTRGVQAGGVRYHAVEVKQDGVVPVAGDQGPGPGGLRHGSLSISNEHPRAWATVLIVGWPDGRAAARGIGARI